MQLSSGITLVPQAIGTLKFNAEGDEPLPNVSSLLPDLEALSMDVGTNHHAGLCRALKRQPTTKNHLFQDWTIPVQ